MRLLSELVDVSNAVAGTQSRLEKRERLARLLREARGPEVPVAVSYLAGTLPQGRIGLGPAILRDLAGEKPAAGPSLELPEIDDAFTRIAKTGGRGSQQKRRDLLAGLFARATASEQDFLARLIVGELRQGAMEGVLVEAIADAAGIPADDVRRAVMLASDPAPVAAAAFEDGPAGLERFRLEPLTPVRPMLAQPAADMNEALAKLGCAALEVKLDGARVQVHRAGGDLRIFSRQLNDVTASLPEIVEAVRALPAETLIVDGEVIALGEGGHPLPFQVTMRRFGRKSDVETLRAELPLSLYLFDCLYRDGEALIDRTLAWQTRRLLELETRREEHVVYVQPELVVEIAVNEIQQSSQYPAGMALRFARVRRYRKDKKAEEADTVATVRKLFATRSH